MLLTYAVANWLFQFFWLSLAFRYFDGSYAEGGKYYTEISEELRPLFGSRNDTWTLSILPFVCMTYEAYVMVGSNTFFSLLLALDDLDVQIVLLIIYHLFFVCSITIPPDSIQS
jgi:hypothetical protein